MENYRKLKCEITYVTDDHTTIEIIHLGDKESLSAFKGRVLALIDGID